MKLIIAFCTITLAGLSVIALDLDTSPALGTRVADAWASTEPFVASELTLRQGEGAFFDRGPAVDPGCDPDNDGPDGPHGTGTCGR